MERQLLQIQQGAEEVYPLSLIKKKLSWSIQNQVPLRVKFQLNASIKKTILRKLQLFQALGHQVLIVTGEDGAEEHVWHDQLDPQKTEFYPSCNWYQFTTFPERGRSLREALAGQVQMDQCYRNGEAIPVQALFQSIIQQGYDSVLLKTDIEISESSQRERLLTGRKLQKEFGIEPQVIITVPPESLPNPNEYLYPI